MLFLYSIQMVLFLSAYNILLISEVFKYVTEFLLGAKYNVPYKVDMAIERNCLES